MASAEVRVPISSMLRRSTMHVTVTGLRAWGIRRAVGVFLIRLGVRALGAREVEFKFLVKE